MYTVGNTLDKVDTEAVPLSTFAYGEQQCGTTVAPVAIEEESFQVRSEGEDASDNIIQDDVESSSSEEDEMSEVVTSDEEEDCLEEDKENQENVVAADKRPQRMTRTRVNYAIESDDEVIVVHEVSGESQDEMETDEDDTKIDTLSSGDVLIDEACGTLSSVESILYHRRGDGGKKEMRVKFFGTSYRKTAWVDREDLVAIGKHSLVRGYDKRRDEDRIDPHGDLDEGVHPEWCVVERILGTRQAGDGTEYLVKWCGLSYSHSTWESSEDLCSDEDKVALKRYEDCKSKEQAKVEGSKLKGRESSDIDIGKIPTFCNGRTLRDYQVESLKWMIQNWYNGKNCILGDEMGLGKTAQSISCIEYQRQFGNASDPFLIIAPLTTLGHWKREIETWTDMNCVLYCGTAKDKKIIRTYEMWCEGADKLVKPDVVLSSYEHVMRDGGFFQSIEWETMIIDEAHRMKGTKGATRTIIADIPCQWILLLTGTPVQNNVKELFGLLNLLDPEQHGDEDEFLDRFGRSTDKMTPEQVRDLQRSLRPILLRRMKEDVETLPEKEECIIWVQLTRDQRAYYKAIFENQIGVLLSGKASKNAPVLRNVAMELRKVCCHPFLCDGIEDDMIARNTKEGKSVEELDLLVSSCGKMQLIHKLLPKLRAENRRVLIFSQFTIMLNVLEDYCNLMNYPMERIDGMTSSRDRQASIDRFSSTDKDGFIFLLSTKAGGQGITLTAADTCILYDSDWNPQNDLQAMARCHRIGQTKDVTIYRLVSKDTYEENLFRESSRKYGLDEAILGDLGTNQGGRANPENDGKRISELLKHGAHCLKDADQADKETDAFLSENIEEILTRRTEKRQIGGRAGNTFSVANFGENMDVSKKDDKEFWKSVLPDACKTFEHGNAAPMEILPPRKKRSINYNEKDMKRKKMGDDFEYDFKDDSSDEDGPERKGVKKSDKPKKAKEAKPKVKKWTAADLNKLLEFLLRYGMNIERFKSWDGGVSYFQSKGYEENIVLQVGEILREGLYDLVERVPERRKNSGYIVHKDAKPEDLEISDRMYLESLKKYERDVTDITEKYMLVDLPDKIRHRFSSPDEFGFSYDIWEKIFSRMANFAHNILRHIRTIECIEERLIKNDTVTRLPFVSTKKAPKFWSHYNGEHDANLLRAIYRNGWDWSMRTSTKHFEEIENILRTDEKFSEFRRLYLGSASAPPETEEYISKSQWEEEPSTGYKELAKVLHGRMKVMGEELWMWKKFSDKAKSKTVTPDKEAPSITCKSTVEAVSLDDLKTPAHKHAALDVFSKGTFTGPAPSVEPQSNIKAPCRQRSILDTFKIKPKQTDLVVDIDLTNE